VRLTTHVHPLPRLRMSGDVPYLPIYAFVACRGTVLLFITTTITIGITAAFLYSKDRIPIFDASLYCLFTEQLLYPVMCRVVVWCVYTRRYGRFGEIYCVYFYVQQLKQHLLSRSSLQNNTFHIPAFVIYFPEPPKLILHV
jgi:hypothetical protein